MYFTKNPKWLRWLYPSAIEWSKQDKKTLFLTFDDGPHPSITNWILEELDKYNAKATFFCLGENIKQYPNIITQLLEKEHQVGNHGYHHLNGWKTDISSYIKNVENCGNLLPPSAKKLFRPPYGKITKQQAKILLDQQYRIIMWDVMAGDFDQTRSPQTCLSKSIAAIRDGSILVLHDNDKAAQNLRFLLPRLLDYYHNLGWSFETL